MSNPNDQLLIYLAGPIDHIDIASASRWYDDLKVELLRFDHTVFCPWDAFINGAMDIRTQRINNEALAQADALIAWVPAGVVTYGTPIEIQRARDLGKPVFLVTDIRMDSAVFAGLPQGSVKDALVWLVGLEQPLGPKLKVKRLHPDARLPTKGHADDTGFDLYVCEGAVLAPFDFYDIPVGIAVEVPPGHWCEIVSRSSAFRNFGLDVRRGIIDYGYRGELFIGVHNANNSIDVHVTAGQRLAQLIVHHNTGENLAPVWVDELSDTTRGHGGFGSTGA